ncbi:unnamed protein product [Rotaria sordida]|uniref:UBC core domain-containing protein n=1 Tax=Rotaria sordida TaxID=392033 RepID=A0A815F7X1_9BILA|nr:unnamed protein product [Rotaria sordida]
MSLPFKSQNTKAAATKRIIRDLRDLDKHPIPGLGVNCPDESNPFVLHCNVLINDGPYKGIMIHLILHIPEDYPLTGPAGNIAPGLEFDSSYHAHIHYDGRNGHALCNDLLTNYAEHFRTIDHGSAKQATGWSPGYTLSTALLQIVTFFAEPDLVVNPSPQSIENLHRIVKKFKCITCDHTYDKPNPIVVDYTAIVSVKPEENQEILTKEDEEQLKVERERIKFQRELIEKLTCGVTKQNVIEDNICLGYPLLIKRDNIGRLWSEIVLELISYDAYVAEIQKTGGDKLDFYEHWQFRSVTGRDYNHWLPIYINENHFEKGKLIIQNSISVIHYGTARGNARYDFTPSMALSVLTALMNKSAVQLFNGQMFESRHAIEAYCHFLRLLMHFIDIYPELDRKINDRIENFMRGLRYRNKNIIPDMGEFLIQIALSSKYKLDEIRKYVYEEYFARQIYWIERNSSIRNLLDIRSPDLLDIFKSVKVSNHLLVFNLEMAQTFIFSGVKKFLDAAYGYPPPVIVENFQQRLKAIKVIDRYSEFIQAIRLSDKIRSSDDTIDLIKRSIQISNEQGYTRIVSRDQERIDHQNKRTRYEYEYQRRSYH